MTEGKFLRRPQADGPEGQEGPLRDIEGLLPPEIRTDDVRAAAEAVLRKLDILRDRGKKLKILRALAQMNAPWVSAVLLELLGDSVEEVRDMAVRELCGRDDWPTSVLYERLDRPPWFAKSAALRLLAERKDKEAVPHIKRLIEDPNVDVKRSAALALGAIGGREARSLLVVLARDKSHYVRTAAEEMLGQLCDFKFS